MKPVRCPTCDLTWNIADDAPAIITCPRCLAALNNPYSTAPTSGPTLSVSPQPSPSRPPPLPVRELEHQVRRDVRASQGGLILIVVVVIGGMFTFFIAVAQGLGPGAWDVLALVVIAACAITPLWVASRNKPATVQAIAMAGTAPRSAPIVAPGDVVEYGRPARDPRKLSPGAFFAQVIGGIILGIVGGFLLAGLGSGLGLGQNTGLLIFAPAALGAFLCAKPRVRGLGVGLIVALPVAFLLFLGFCAILIGKGSFH